MDKGQVTMEKADRSPKYIMHATRESMEDGLDHVDEQVDALEHAVYEQPNLALSLAKTLVESVCKSILTERGIAYGKNDSLPRLFHTVTTGVSLLPMAASGEAKVRKSLERTVNGLHTALQGICELRNSCGFAAHGSEGSQPSMESNQALLAAEIADTIVGFVYRAHHESWTRVVQHELKLDDNPEFNDYVDEAFGRHQIFEVEYRSSQLLYSVDPGAYRAYLAEGAWQQPPEQERSDVPVEVTTEQTPEAGPC